jgi:ParB family chromosome partitioning protein
VAKKVLGRGLDALLPEVGPLKEGVVIEANMATIKPNRYQPRRTLDPRKLEELTSSISEKGVIQPVLARVTPGGYELIAGERRWRAAKKMGLKKIPLIVKEVSDTEMLEMALIENIQREDLNPIDEALCYQRVIEEFKIKQEGLAREIGKDRSSIANTLRLLRLPPEVQRDVSRGTISRGHGLALLGLEKAEMQIAASKKIKAEGLSVREAEALVEKLKIKISGSKTKRPKSIRSAQLMALEDELRRILATQVRIKPRGKKGTIEIEYYSHEQLEGILERVRGHDA